jgi:hypothetical protein
MNASPDLERRLTDFYAGDAPQRAPDWLLGAALETIDSTPQRRRFIRMPWRLPNMNTYAKVATAGVAVVAVGAIGLTVLRPAPSGPGGQIASPSPEGSPSFGPSNVAPPAPAITETFTSDIHGISIGYPAGWSTDPATDRGATGAGLFGDPTGDYIFDPTLADHLFLRMGSQPVVETQADEWIAEQATILECSSTESLTIDGVAGAIGAGGCQVALVVTGGRGYVIGLFTSADEWWLDDTYDQSWFMDVLATVQLDPASAAPPMPALDATFDSSLYGLSIAHPSGWTITPGSGPWTSGLPLETADTIQQGQDNVFLRVASQPLEGRTGQEWADEIVGHADWGDSCDVEPEPFLIDGTAGQFVRHCPDDVFNGLTWTADRGYLIIGYGIGDSTWFKDVLSSVQLQ